MCVCVCVSVCELRTSVTLSLFTLVTVFCLLFLLLLVLLLLLLSYPACQYFIVASCMLYIHIHTRVFIYIRLFIKLNTLHNVAAHAHAQTCTHTVSNILLALHHHHQQQQLSSSSSAALLLLLLLSRIVVVIVDAWLSATYIHTRAHTYTPREHVSLSLSPPDKTPRTKCLSLKFPA